LNTSGRRRRVRRGTVVLLTGLLCLTASTATAGIIEDVDSITLQGRQQSRWDFSNTSGSCTIAGAFSPASDGELGDKSDAFDGGLALSVDGTAFTDSDGEITSLGQPGPFEPTLGPEPIAGVNVTRKERALLRTPTLRSLVGFRNNGGSPVTLTVRWDSNLGSDSSEEVRASSSGNLSYGLGDRWVVSSDAASGPSDPVLTFVLFGKRARERPNLIVNNFGSGCFGVEYEVTVPANGTRYLLFFTQMNATNNAARNRAVRFNKDLSGSEFLAGLSTRVRSKILNWDV
jgi:hypothetical protein